MRLLDDALADGSERLRAGSRQDRNLGTADAANALLALVR
jgi:hypothetical protein